MHFVAARHQLWVLSTGPAKLAEVEALNPAVPALRYWKIAGLHGPETRPPAGDSDWAQVERQNLMAKDALGRPVRQTYNHWYFIDILDPAKRAAWTSLLIARLKTELVGYGGVMLDNSNVVHPTLWTAPPDGYTPAKYHDAIHEILRAVKAALPDKLVVFNSYEGFADPGLRGPEMLDVADGIYFEAFAYKTNGGKLFDRPRLELQLRDFAAAAATGKITVALDYAKSTDLDRRMLTLAGYLLAAGDRSYLFFSGVDLHTDIQEYPEQTLDLGAPVDAMTARDDGLWSRRYERGVAFVNVNDGTEVKLDDSLTKNRERLTLVGGGAFPSHGSLSWAPAASSITVPPMTGVVLRDAAH